MSQTILVETHEDLKKIFSLNLSTFVGTDVILRRAAEDTMALLKILPEVSLIVCRNKVGEEETAKILHNFIKNEALETSLIVLGECPDIASEVMCLKDPVNWEILVRQAAYILGVTLKEANQKVKSDYIPVGLFYFYDIQKTPCDVYIRIKKGPQEYQYVKRIHSKDVFDRNDIQKYEDQGLKEFYIPKDYIQYFTTFVTNQLLAKLEREDLTLEDRILTTANSHDIIRETLQNFGLDEASIDLSEASIGSMIKSLKRSPEMASLLKFLFSNKVSYAYQQCHLQALLGHYILSKQSWFKPEHLQVLSFVAFFSDVTLKSIPQMQIASLHDLENSTLTDEERVAVINHARDAAIILETHPTADPYIKTVIKQSHGTRDGVGFNDNPGEELHPLSKIFIIADNFVKILLNPNLPSNKKDILPLLYGRFTEPSYQSIIKTLEQKIQ